MKQPYQGISQKLVWEIQSPKKKKKGRKGRRIWIREREKGYGEGRLREGIWRRDLGKGARKHKDQGYLGLKSIHNKKRRKGKKCVLSSQKRNISQIHKIDAHTNKALNPLFPPPSPYFSLCFDACSLLTFSIFSSFPIFLSMKHLRLRVPQTVLPLSEPPC